LTSGATAALSASATGCVGQRHARTAANQMMGLWTTA